MERIMGWTPELIKDLKKHWKRGLTTGEIGRLIGMSKNAVVGKAHRLGLESRPSPIKRTKAETVKAPKPAAVKTVKPKKIEPVIKEIDMIEVEPVVEPAKKVVKKKSSGKGVKLVDLKPSSCRWPEGDPKDPDFHFCGKEAVPGKAYCAEHCDVAYSGVFKAR